MQAIFAYEKLVPSTRLHDVTEIQNIKLHDCGNLAVSISRRSECTHSHTQDLQATTTTVHISVYCISPTDFRQFYRILEVIGRLSDCCVQLYTAWYGQKK